MEFGGEWGEFVMLGYVVHDRASEIIAVVGWFLFVLIVGLSGRLKWLKWE